jgi:hypothetical protein
VEAYIVANFKRICQISADRDKVAVQPGRKPFEVVAFGVLRPRRAKLARRSLARFVKMQRFA